MLMPCVSNNAVSSIKASDRAFSKSGSERSAILVIPSFSGCNVKFCQDNRVESQQFVWCMGDLIHSIYSIAIMNVMEEMKKLVNEWRLSKKPTDAWRGCDIRYYKVT